MAERKKLKATVRSGIGKGASRGVRREGSIPGVIYGGGDAAEPITLEFRELNKLIYAGHFLTTIFDIEIDGATQRVIPRDYQLDRVKDKPLHVDFLRLKPGAMLRVEIPIHFQNTETCPGVKKGGTLNMVRHAVQMKVPADNIPEALVADLSTLEINEPLHISKLPMPEGCSLIERDRDFTIANIVPPVAVVEDPAAAAAAAAKGGKGKGKAAPKPAAAAPAAKAKK